MYLQAPFPIRELEVHSGGKLEMRHEPAQSRDVLRSEGWVAKPSVDGQGHGGNRQPGVVVEDRDQQIDVFEAVQKTPVELRGVQLRPGDEHLPRIDSPWWDRPVHVEGLGPHIDLTIIPNVLGDGFGVQPGADP